MYVFIWVRISFEYYRSATGKNIIFIGWLLQGCERIYFMLYIENIYIFSSLNFFSSIS